MLMPFGQKLRATRSVDVELQLWIDLATEISVTRYYDSTVVTYWKLTSAFFEIVVTK